MAAAHAPIMWARTYSGDTAFPPANEITVLFDDSAQSFSMPAAATFAELAQRVVEQGERPRGRMISVIVKLSQDTGASPFETAGPATTE